MKKFFKSLGVGLLILLFGYVSGALTVLLLKQFQILS